MRYLVLVLVAACSSGPPSIDDYCADHPCPMTLARATDPASYDAACDRPGARIQLARCPRSTLAVLQTGVDTDEEYYFDASGALVRITNTVNVNTFTVAGDDSAFGCNETVEVVPFACPQ